MLMAYLSASWHQVLSGILTTVVCMELCGATAVCSSITWTLPWWVLQLAAEHLPESEGWGGVWSEKDLWTEGNETDVVCCFVVRRNGNIQKHYGTEAGGSGFTEKSIVHLDFAGGTEVVLGVQSRARFLLDDYCYVLLFYCYFTCNLFEK